MVSIFPMFSLNRGLANAVFGDGGGTHNVTLAQSVAGVKGDRQQNGRVLQTY